MLSEIFLITGSLVIAFSMAGLFFKKNLILILRDVFGLFLGALVVCIPFLYKDSGGELFLFALLALILTQVTVVSGLAFFRRRSQQTKRSELDSEIRLRY